MSRKDAVGFWGHCGGGAGEEARSWRRSALSHVGHDVMDGGGVSGQRAPG